MSTLGSLIYVIASLSLISPPAVPKSVTPIATLEALDVQIQGRDPLSGTGLCGPLLPVNGPADVAHVSFPRGQFSRGDIYCLRQFPNLESVRFRSPIKLEDHLLIRGIVPADTWLIYRVYDRKDATKSYRQALSLQADEDINGDGVVDENDVIIDD